MAEKSATDVEDQSKDFVAGFEDKDAAAETAPKPEETSKKDPDPEPAPKEDPAPKAEEKPEDKPEAVTLTKEQFDKLMTAADETASLKSQMSKAFGTMGNMQQVINRLQDATTKGEPIKLTRAIVAKLEKDFPELADGQFDALEQLVNMINQSGGRGTGDDKEPTAEKTPPADKLRQEQMAREVESLEDAYPDWKDIVGAVSDGQYDPKHPFRSWLATQPEDYRQRINNTSNARVIERAIDRFKAAEADKAKTVPKPVEPAPNPRAVARKEILRSSLQPRGSGPEPTQNKTAADHFAEGFERG